MTMTPKQTHLANLTNDLRAILEQTGQALQNAAIDPTSRTSKTLFRGYFEVMAARLEQAKMSYEGLVA